MACVPPRAPRYSIRIWRRGGTRGARGFCERTVALLDEAGLMQLTLPEVGEQLQPDRDTMTRALRELSLNRFDR